MREFAVRSRREFVRDDCVCPERNDAKQGVAGQGSTPGRAPVKAVPGYRPSAPRIW